MFLGSKIPHLSCLPLPKATKSHTSYSKPFVRQFFFELCGDSKKAGSFALQKKVFWRFLLYIIYAGFEKKSEQFEPCALGLKES